MPLFGPPNVEKMKANRDLAGLQEALRYPDDPAVRMQAACALEALGWQPPNASAGAVYSIARGKFSWCVQIGAEAVPALAEAAKDKDSRVRRSAALALGRIGGTGAVRPLVGLLKDKDDGVLQAVEASLAQVGDLAIDPLVQYYAENPGEQERIMAASVLARLGPEALEKLAGRIRSVNWILSASMLHPLAKSKNTAFLPPLVVVLGTSPDLLVRASAADALGELGDRQAALPLAEAFALACTVRDYTLGELHMDHVHQAEDNVNAIPLLGIGGSVDLALIGLEAGKAVLKTAAAAVGPTRLAEATAAALGRLGDPAAVDVLVACLLQSRTGKEYAPKPLGQIGDRRAVDPLRTLLDDNDKGVRKAAKEALEKLVKTRAPR